MRLCNTVANYRKHFTTNMRLIRSEFRRGKVAEWKQLLALLYGERGAEELILRARDVVNLSIPPSGPLSADGRSYEGWDSFSDGGFIGKLT
jgi:hypothetical protein